MTGSVAPGSDDAVRLLRLASLVSAFDRFVVPTLLLAIAADLDASLAEVAAAATAYYLLYGGLQPVWGLLSDRIGRVRLIRLALVGTTVAGAAAAAAPTLAVLVVLRGATAAFYAAVVPTALVYVGDTVPLATRQRALVDLMTGTYTGAFLASVLGGVAAGLGLWRLGLLLPAVAGAVIAVRLRRLVEPPPPATRAGPRTLALVLRHPATLLVIGLVLVEGAVVHGVLTFVPAALETLGVRPSLAGLAVGVFGIGVLLGTATLRRHVARRSPATLLAVGGAIIALAWAVAALGLTLPVGAGARTAVVALAVTVMGGGFAAMHTTLQTWATEVLPTARATVISLFAGSLFAGGAIATAVAAPAVDAGRAAPVLLVAAATTVPLTVAAAVTRRRRDRGAAPRRAGRA